MAQIRTAIVGVGNCAAALLQGITYYKNDHESSETIVGLMHPDFHGYSVSDIEVVAAFDVDVRKVAVGLGEAALAAPNNTIHFSEVPVSDVIVQRGPTLDGLGKYHLDRVRESPMPPVDVAAELRRAGAEVVVSYLPVGSQLASEFYAQAAIDAGCALVNCIPVFIASHPLWARRFASAGLPVLGDDIKSQLGATISHRDLVELFEARGVVVDHTYQLNIGGNMDFRNMLDRDRMTSKQTSKRASIDSAMRRPPLDPESRIGASDYVDWLEDRKRAYVVIEGRGFGQTPITLEYKLEAWDSPNSAGVVVDAVRAAKVALDRGLAGPITDACAHMMKSPPVQMSEHDARRAMSDFIEDPSSGNTSHIGVNGEGRG